MAEGAGEILTAAVRHRGALRGPSACVAADHPLAAQAGARVLHEGGSAADAAVAMAAVMTVVQPYYSHLGGDLFALVYDGGRVEALNSSGPAPLSANVVAYRARGRISETGARAVTIPGCVDGWWQLHRRHGRMPWARLFDDARRYAGDGFPASRQLVASVREAGARVAPAAAFAETIGVATHEGRMVRQPALSRTFAAVAEGGVDAFYSGEVARACRARLAADGVDVTAEEWRGPARWEEPVTAPFAGHTIYTQPAPSQGFVLPLALALTERLRLAESGLADAVLQHSALAVAFALRNAEAGDPDFTGFDAQRALDAVLAGRPAGDGLPPAEARDGDTTYLLAVDADGMAVSLIQSIFAGWGSGVYVPESGVLMNNRMCGFTLEEGHPNVLAGGKRPMHTLHSYIATGGDGRLRVVGGTPGAMQQPLTNLMVLDAILREGSDPQDALDRPRWSMGSFAALAPGYRKVTVEAHGPDRLMPAFRDAGIAVESVPSWSGAMGRAYVAVREESGLAVAADPRGEGLAITW